MIRSTIFALVGSIFFTACAPLQSHQFFPSKVWNVDERAEFASDQNYIEKFIRVPLNPEKKSDGYFDLYYFIRRPDREGLQLEVKTVLFCAGGPGEIVEPGGAAELFAAFLRNLETT